VDEISTVEFCLKKSEIELWCPQNPKLYKTELSTDCETICDEIGYREIRTEGRQIILNGEPIRLYGLSVHSEFKDSGRTATEAGLQMIIDKAKDLGVNFLRCAHYPYAESFGRAMDKAGLMWWEEVPAYWLSNMADPGQTEKACGMMHETILRDWNRASIIIWSVSNECCYRNPNNYDDNNYAYWFTVVPMVRELDPSRLISCAEAGNMISVTPVWDPEKADEFKRDLTDKWLPGHSDEWYELFDVLAANIYLNGGEDPNIAYRKYVEMLYDHNKPMMLSEFGSMSLLGADEPDDVLGGEGFHCDIIRTAYESFKNLPDLIGYSPWCLNDVRVPIHWRWYNQGKGVFRYGFLDENWQEKKAYKVLKDGIKSLKEHFGDK
jgi:beta-glucuronidase